MPDMKLHFDGPFSFVDEGAFYCRWINEHNEKRLHDSSKGLPITMYLEMATREVSPYEAST